MKKILAVILAAVMTFTMCACGTKADENSGITNPLTECTQEELLETTGFDLVAPDGAENISYAYIAVEEEEPIAQLQFTVDGKEYCYRAQSTGATSIMNSVGDDGFYMAEDLLGALNEGVNVGAALSGLNYEWKASATIDISYCEGVAAFNEGDAGFVAWLDVAPGVLYSLSMEDDCNQDLLMNMAESIFVPVQGDAE